MLKTSYDVKIIKTTTKKKKKGRKKTCDDFQEEAQLSAYVPPRARNIGNREST